MKVMHLFLLGVVALGLAGCFYEPAGGGGRGYHEHRYYERY
jgi:hypothetical protein